MTHNLCSLDEHTLTETHTEKIPMSSPDSRWISYLNHNLLGDHQYQDFPWNDPSAGNEAVKVDSLICQPDSGTCSTENENSKGDSFNDNRKRVKDDSSSGPQGKAGREKMRRDRMNDRFVELSAVLEPEKPPKTDKASILRDAARIISQLRAEAQHLKGANKQLQETIMELKVEKNELREEKLTLKTEKETLEKRMKSIHYLPGYATHAVAPPVQVVSTLSSSFTTPNDTLYARPVGTPPPVVAQVTCASSSFPSQNMSLYAQPTGTLPYASQNQILYPKPPSFPNNPYSTTMSQWIPQEVSDVSNDHVLRPPVA